MAVYTGMQLFTDNASLSMSVVASCFLQQSELMLLSRKKCCKELLLPFQQALVVSAMQMFHSLSNFTILVVFVLCQYGMITIAVLLKNHRSNLILLQSRSGLNFFSHFPKMRKTHMFSFFVLWIVWCSTNTEYVNMFDYFQLLTQFLYIFNINSCTQVILS